MNDQADFEIEDLPHPEDYLMERGEYALVGLFMRMERAYLVMAETITTATHPTNGWAYNEFGGVASWVAPVVAREGMLEQWLDNAQCYLPDWYFAESEDATS